MFISFHDQELYQTSLSMRPKIVKLIDRYSQKMAELKSMNEKFVSARRTFDRMMEESLSKYNPGAASSEYTQARPEYAAQAQQQAVAQQQDYAQAWAQWYASQGYPAAQQAQQGQVIPGAAPAGHAQPQQSEADAYAQWYYAQQVRTGGEGFSLIW